MKQNYVNGSDLLLKVAGKPVGHCTTHTTTYNSETKDRAVKPVASATVGAGLWKNKSVSGLSVSISFEGLRFYNETEGGFKNLLAQWKAGQSVQVDAFEREEDEHPYMTGNFVFASLEEQAPAGDDATYSGSMENDGEVTIDEDNLTGESIASSGSGTNATPGQS